MTPRFNSLSVSFLFTALFGVFVYFGEAAARGASCGAGCQRQMGSCEVNSQLWSQIVKAGAQGVRATSCCRSVEYNARLRACGYNSSPSSSHMRGDGVDLAVSPSKCTAGGLGSLGFTNVCPYYHDNHCHVSVCGSKASGERVRGEAVERINAVNAQSQRVAFESNYREMPAAFSPMYHAERYPAAYPGAEYNYEEFDDHGPADFFQLIHQAIGAAR